MEERPNIRETEPDDHSGRRSRSGYRYQDLCALRYCVSVATDGDWEEVWCESHDDIVLMKQTGLVERHRFVQVKYQANAGSHWSAAQLCRTPHGKPSVEHSVLCKLFSRDQFHGQSDFRLAVNEGVVDDLKPFHYLWGHEEPAVDLTCRAALDLILRLAPWVPLHGRTREEFVARFAIERHPAEVDDMEARIREELDRLLRSADIALLADELGYVFQDLYQVVYRAASDDWRRKGSSEKIQAEAFRELALARARSVSQQSDTVASGTPAVTLRARLQALGATNAIIQSAIAQRREWVFVERRNRGSSFWNVLHEASGDVRAICVEESVVALETTMPIGPGLLGKVLARVRERHVEGDYAARGVSLGLMQGMCFFLIERGHLSVT